MIKKILFAVGSALVVGALFAKNKISNVTNVVNNLKFKVTKINNVAFNLGSIDINLDLELINQTNIDFTAATGNLLSLQKIEIFTDTGIKVADAFKQISQVNLPPFGTMPITNVTASIPMTNLGNTAISLITSKPEKLIVKAHVNIFGTNYVI